MPPQVKRIYSQEILVNGKPRHVRCAEIGAQTYAARGSWIRIASLEDDWYDDVSSPEQVIDALRSSRRFNADLFTFWQRPPDADPQFPYFRDFEDVAILQVSNFENWMTNQINAKTRNMVRKAAKCGVKCSVTQFDDEFVRGMTRIFNESSMRQGRRFWHYGKDFDTVKEQFSRFVHREIMIRADLNGEMIGHAVLGNAGRFALTGQVISSFEHRDKAVNNALIAKAIEVCAEQGFEFLCYDYWNDNSLTAFKKHCGFERMSLPRYYVPLNLKGSLALKFGLHRNVSEILPEKIKQPLKHLRAAWYRRVAG